LAELPELPDLARKDANPNARLASRFLTSDFTRHRVQHRESGTADRSPTHNHCSHVPDSFRAPKPPQHPDTRFRSNAAPRPLQRPVACEVVNTENRRSDTEFLAFESYFCAGGIAYA